MSIGIRSSGHLRCENGLAMVFVGGKANSTYSTKLITFELFWFAAAKSAFVDQIRQLLLHELFDFHNSFLKARLRGACDVEVERWIL